MNSMHKLLALKVGRQCFMRQISSSCPWQIHPRGGVVEAEVVALMEVASVKQEDAHSLVEDVAEAGAPQVKREINQDARFVRNLIMKRLIADTNLMMNIKLRKDMQQLLHHLTMLI
jgi:hypothetical protein